MFGIPWYIILFAALVIWIAYDYFNFDGFILTLICAAVFLVFNSYKNDRLPEFLTPVASKIFFWVDDEQSNALQSVDNHDMPEDSDRPNYNIGTCTTLTGDVGFAVFFLDDDVSGWTEETGEAFIDDVFLPGGEFLEKQAMLYGVDLNVELCWFSSSDSHSISVDGTLDDLFRYDEAGKVKFDNSNMETHREILDYLADDLGYASSDKLLEGLCVYLDVDQVLPVIVLNKPGWNYSFVDNNPDGTHEPEYVFIYAQTTDGEPVSRTDVIAECAEAFGAQRFTDDPQGRPNDKILAQRLYPHSIMMYDYDFTYNFTDGFTAYALGWIDQLPPEYDERRTEPIQNIEGNPYRSRYDKGTCRNLSGTPYVLTIYIDDDESSWSVDGAYNFQQNVIDPGLALINEQAGRWGVELSFTSGMYVSDPEKAMSVRYSGIIPDYLTTDSVAKDIFDQAALSLQFSSKYDLYQSIQDYSGEEQVVIILAVNKEGRSYAWPDMDTDPGNRIEYCVVYSSWEGATSKHAVAHEVLHLFGAEDLYEEKITNAGYHASRQVVANKLCPNDIMLGAKCSEVCAFTAYAVGWTDSLPDEYKVHEFWEDDMK